MKKPITRGTVVDWKQSKKSYESTEQVIVDRMDYILHTVFEEFGNDFGSWYFHDAGEGQMGHLTWDETDLVMEFYQPKIKNEMIFIDKGGDEYRFDQSIPTRWLFEDFEEELSDGIKKYQEKESQRVKKVLSVKDATKKLAESAKKKLTKEELAALKKTL